MNKIFKRFNIVALALMAVVFQASAASYTASQSGNWSDTNTWDGAGVPGSGDSALINTSPRDVTYDNPVDGPNSAITLSSNGKLTLAVDAVFSGSSAINGGGILDLVGHRATFSVLTCGSSGTPTLNQNGGVLRVTDTLNIWTPFAGTSSSSPFVFGTQDVINVIAFNWSGGYLKTSSSSNLTQRIDYLKGILDLGANLILSGQLSIGKGAGLLRSHGYNITTTNFRLGDWGAGCIEAGPGGVFTADSIDTAADNGNTMTILHEAGKNGVTLNIPTISSALWTKLIFDPDSGGYDWAFRWQGNHKSDIETWVGNGRMTYTNVPAVNIVESADGYTYVYAVPEVVWSSLGATNITDTSAAIYANLEAHGESSAEVTLYWATNSIGKTVNGWMGTNVLGVLSTGLVNGAISGLCGSRTYYCRFYATNSVLQIQGWSDTISFETRLPPLGTVLILR